MSETPATTQLTEREKPKLYTATGEEVTLKKPFGFANHPDVPTQKLKQRGDR